MEALLEATARVLVREGYDRASTNRIAQVAGVNISSLYQYFPSKEALVAALIDRHLEEILQLQASQLMSASDRPLTSIIRDMARAYFEMHTANPRLHRAILEQVPRVERLNPIISFRRQITEQLSAFMSARCEELGVKHPDRAAFIIINVVDSLKHCCLLDRPEYLEDPLFLDEVFDLLQRYLEPRLDRRSRPPSARKA